ncbi:expressed unknown protein [Seminavis robusta]|uniref:Uncharacterized protein n=1 Tax=Seminavis robusta TaxID=568900 RepID=A0A9N8E6C7_9STRA|nr:expressed unknown protein [Seminavis robusta]|eukprot:Sro710_g191010.1 n/a (149) ;mRNA; f:13495-13941
MPRYTEGLLGGFQLPKKPRSPYSLLKNAIKKAKAKHEQRELERQIESMQSALKTYQQRSEEFLIVAGAAFPKIKDCNGDMRHEKDFTVKPRVDGTFNTPRRCRPKRWQGSLASVSEADDVNTSLSLPSFDESVLTVTQPTPMEVSIEV